MDYITSLLYTLPSDPGKNAQQSEEIMLDVGSRTFRISKKTLLMVPAWRRELSRAPEVMRTYFVDLNSDLFDHSAYLSLTTYLVLPDDLPQLICR